MGAWESARNASLNSARRVAGPFNTTKSAAVWGGGSETPEGGVMLSADFGGEAMRCGGWLAGAPC